MLIAGSIEVIPLGVNEQALLTLFPAPMVDVGLGPGERAQLLPKIDGGLIGLIMMLVADLELAVYSKNVRQRLLNGTKL